jgi:hypothetical protein
MFAKILLFIRLCFSTFLLFGLFLSPLSADSGFEPVTELERRELFLNSSRFQLADQNLRLALERLLESVDGEKAKYYLADQEKWLEEGLNRRTRELGQSEPRARAIILATEERISWLEDAACREKGRRKDLAVQETKDFTGQWYKVENGLDATSTIVVTGQDAKSFSFSFSGRSGDNRGEIYDKAVFTSPTTAICVIVDGYARPAEISFTMREGQLLVNGGPKSGFFGRGVDIDGLYRPARENLAQSNLK